MEEIFGRHQQSLRAGADKVSINTTAVKNPEFVREASNKFGNQCIVVTIDAKRSQNTESGFEISLMGAETQFRDRRCQMGKKKMQDYGAGEHSSHLNG